MGVTWRRVNERMMQMGSFSFSHGAKCAATSNARNEAMFAEATEFAKHIQVLEKDVNKVLRHMEVHFTNLGGILTSPIPRIYEEGPDGSAVPLEEECQLGQGMDTDAIPRALETAKFRVDVEVISPLMEWLEAFKAITEKMKSIESVRLELDSRRRTVSSLKSRYERLQSQMTTSHKIMAEVKDLEDVVGHKEMKMSRCLATFQELERTIFNSLYTLVKDTAVLRDYTHQILTIFQTCFEQAAASYSCPANPQAQLGSAKPPLFKQQSSKGSKNMLTGMFGKLMGKKDPDTKQHKDQAREPPAVPGPPAQLFLQQSPYDGGADAAQEGQSTPHSRAPWAPDGYPPHQASPPAQSAASGTGQSAHCSPALHGRGVGYAASPRGVDQAATGYGYEGQDGYSVLDVGTQPYPQMPHKPAAYSPQAYSGKQQQPYMAPAMTPTKTRMAPSVQDEGLPSAPPCPVGLPMPPMGSKHPQHRYNDVRPTSSTETGWSAQGC